jgi:hypothetical protein
MNRIMTAALVAIAVSLGAIALGTANRAQEAQPLEFKLESSGENILGENIYGRWVVKADFTEYVAGEKVPDEVSGMVFEFSKDADLSAKVLAELAKVCEQMAGDKRKSAAGEELKRHKSSVLVTGKIAHEMGEQKQEAAFAVTTFFGNTMLWILETKKDGSLDWESANIAWVNDPEGNHDLLFLGGDHKNEPFLCFQREEAAKGK